MENDTLNIQLNSDKTLVSNENNTERIIEIRLQAPEAHQADSRPDLNLALVIDRSGSMQGDKLEFVKQAAAHVLDQLQSHDRVALIAYDSHVQVLAPSISVSNGNRFELKQLLTTIHSGSSTNLRDGWLTGCKEIAASAQDVSINRTLLLTDGLANVGETNPEILAQHAFELQKDSLSTSTFGVGYEFNEHLLEAMANKGGGNFYFIEDPADISRIFLKEFGELVGVSALKVEVRLDLPMSMQWQVLGGWSSEYKDGSLHIYVGDMLSLKTQDIYIRLQVPVNQNVQDISLTARVFGRGKQGQVYDSQANLTLQYTGQREVQAAPENRELLERFSIVDLADTAAEALKLERKGERERASQMLNERINLNRPYVSTQDSLNYSGMSDRMKRGMDEADRKRSHQDSYRQKREKENH
jgi:Ca-activated chloride channel homolog